MDGDGLGVFECAAVFKVGGDAGCPEGVAADLVRVDAAPISTIAGPFYSRESRSSASGESIFQGERMTAQLLDRFLHRRRIMETTGEIYQFRE